MTIEEKLRENALRFADKTALKVGDERCSYAQLYQLACQKAEALGRVQGSIVPIIAHPTIDFVASYFGIHLAGAVAAPLSADLPKAKQAELEAMFASSVVPSGVADILYTTGTTGTPKCVMISHRTIMADTENLVEAQQFGANLTFIVNGPLNHIGSLSKIYPTLYVGGTVCLVDGMKNLALFFDEIRQAPSKAATFLVPASIRMLLFFAHDQLVACSSKIDFIETGAAPMAQTDMEQLCRLLPTSRLYNTYASTETGIISTFDYNQGECIAGCLGRPMKHASLYITDEGRVACQGATLMTGYLNNSDATRTILHDDTLFTSDFGYLDDQGRLHLQGRNDDVINVGGFKISPVEVEDAALAYPAVRDCVCIPATHPVIGRTLKLLVVPTHPFEEKDLSIFLKARLEMHKIPTQFEMVDHINRTFNGKIDRKSYLHPKN